MIDSQTKYKKVKYIYIPYTIFLIIVRLWMWPRDIMLVDMIIKLQLNENWIAVDWAHWLSDQSHGFKLGGSVELTGGQKALCG